MDWWVYDAVDQFYCVFFLQASGGMCPFYCFNDEKNWIGADACERTRAPWRGGCAPLLSCACVAAAGWTKDPAQTDRGCVAFLGAMTHFSSQRILGRVMRSQVGWSGPMTSRCREQAEEEWHCRFPRHCSGMWLSSVMHGAGGSSSPAVPCR